jgi:hypothetical protein
MLYFLALMEVEILFVFSIIVKTTLKLTKRLERTAGKWIPENARAIRSRFGNNSGESEINSD